MTNMIKDLRKTRRTLVAVSVLGAGLLAAVIAGISLHAQGDPDRELYDNDTLFEQLSAGGQMRLIAEFGPRLSASIASPLNLLQGLLALADAPTDPPYRHRVLGGDQA